MIGFYCKENQIKHDQNTISSPLISLRRLAILLRWGYIPVQTSSEIQRVDSLLTKHRD